MMCAFLASAGVLLTGMVLFVFETGFLLCGPGWPEIHRFACLCLLGLKCAPPCIKTFVCSFLLALMNFAP